MTQRLRSVPSDERLAELRQKARKQRRKSRLLNGAAIAALIAGIVALFAVLLCLSAVIIQFAWNVGVDGAANAAGGNVNDISFVTALGLSFVITTLKGIFTRTTTEVKS